ncbi:MAG: hypothetical protein IH861_16020 [Chloroflexi bacterium]|nr:hypothetical protein [Chloroflexota bacterium]
MIRLSPIIFVLPVVVVMAACTVAPSVPSDRPVSDALSEESAALKQPAEMQEGSLLAKKPRSIEASNDQRENVSSEPAAPENALAESREATAPEETVSESGHEVTPTQTSTASPTPEPTPTPTLMPRPTRAPTSTPTAGVSPADHEVWPSPTPTKAPQTAVDSHFETPIHDDRPAPTISNDDDADAHGEETVDGGAQEDFGSAGHEGSDGQYREDVPCESGPSPKFTNFVTDLDSIDIIWPTVALSGNLLKNRSYFAMKVDGNGQVEEQPVYAPADARLIEITYYIQPMQTRDGEWVDVPQYDLRFELSCEVMFWFDHMSRLDGPIAELAPKEPSPTTRDAARQVSLEVKGGDIIAHTTGTITAHTWDFIMKNESKEAQFANQERYQLTSNLDHLLRTDCPYDYYEPEMRDAYYELFGAWGGKSEDPSCGDNPDKLGTISGGWFKEPFVNDGTPKVDPGWGLVAAEGPDGWIYIDDERNTVRLDPENPTYADPKTVTTEHCYESTWRPMKFAYLGLQGDMEIAVAMGDGPCPSRLPEDHQVYYR